MADRTLDAVERQVRAMGASTFEIGLFKPAVEGMSPTTRNASARLECRRFDQVRALAEVSKHRWQEHLRSSQR